MQGLSTISPDTSCHRLGFTGSPGVGKSTLINAFAQDFLANNPQGKLAILTIDPVAIDMAEVSWETSLECLISHLILASLLGQALIGCLRGG